MSDREFEALDLAICAHRLATIVDSTEEMADHLRPISNYAHRVQWAMQQTAFNCRFSLYAKETKSRKALGQPSQARRAVEVAIFTPDSEPESILGWGFIEVSHTALEQFAKELTQIYEHLFSRTER